MTSIPREELQALKARAMIAEKGAERFSVRLRVVGGYMTAAHLRTIAALAERFGRGNVHLTTRQSLEIPHVAYENLQPLRAAIEEAGLELASAGKSVRTITACPGTVCAFGQIDTQRLARSIDQRFGRLEGLPHKFKIGISGCGNGCIKPRENDLGIQGGPRGLAVFVGGKMGKQPRMADLLPLTVADPSHLSRIIASVLDWYRAHGKERERFGTTIDRVGLDALVRYLQEHAAPEETSPCPAERDQIQ